MLLFPRKEVLKKRKKKPYFIENIDVLCFHPAVSEKKININQKRKEKHVIEFKN